MKLEISNKRKIRKFSNIFKNLTIYSSTTNGQREIKREIKKYSMTKENGNTLYQKFMGLAKAVLTKMFLMTNAYIMENERS